MIRLLCILFLLLMARPLSAAPLTTNVIAASRLVGRTNFVWWVTINASNAPVATVNYTNLTPAPPSAFVITWPVPCTVQASTNLTATNWTPRTVTITCSASVPNSGGFTCFRVPLNPPGLTLSTNSSHLVWNPSTDPTVTGYNLYYGGASGNYTNMVNVGSATNFTVTGLSSYVTYYFVATTYNISGVQSPFSNEVSYTVPGPSNSPPAIAKLP